MTTVLVPHTIDLELRDGPASGGVDPSGALDADIVVYDAHAPSFDPHLQTVDVLVVWQNTSENLQAATRLPGLRLVQTLAAGPDAVVEAGFGPSVRICSGRSLHDGTVAEHTLALLLHLVRRLDQLGASQRSASWDHEYRADQEDPASARAYTLHDAHVVVLGFGSIAERLTPMLRLLGAHVTGVATSGGERAGVPVRPVREVLDVVTDADVVVNLLPATETTRHLVDAALLERLAPGAVVVNVGRGATSDTDALVAALRSGRIRAAALDVFEQEPLPSSSTLWHEPGLVLTPHVAGNRPRGSGALVRRNVLALQQGAPLENVVR
ncbi:NAD(P)-dependent oxidoreductase (plasmid) [Curtobacterium sp. MCLR17_007]|uniref:NAD(P)-dependent oxidoreductase n=1 Tax=Curtobacterium sp. MCLR17_007 TaxID=2175648 RepID=UPI000DA9C948|nr:NAD(P)-dependent oxidoreductase [Curtobacterium sp. MCLR17_007]WIB62104.1 NAD(P)-dependent oxidoreductase [Curtobacterium sp. MCLR17_007]